MTCKVDSLILLDGHLDKRGGEALLAIDGPGDALVGGLAGRVDLEVGGAGLEDLLLGVELGVRHPLETVHHDGVARLGTGRRYHQLDLEQSHFEPSLLTELKS